MKVKQKGHHHFSYSSLFCFCLCSVCVQFEGSAIATTIAQTEGRRTTTRASHCNTSMLNMQEKQSMSEKVIGKSSNKEDKR